MFVLASFWSFFQVYQVDSNYSKRGAWLDWFDMWEGTNEEKQQTETVWMLFPAFMSTDLCQLIMIMLLLLVHWSNFEVCAVLQAILKFL